MRSTLFLLVALGIWSIASVQSRAQENVVMSSNGDSQTTTPAFSVGDKWEIRWSSPGVISITVLDPDGNVVAGTSGIGHGSFYLPKGGNFHLRVEYTLNPQPPANNAPPDTTNNPSNRFWNIQVVGIGTASAGTLPAPGQGPLNASNYVPPSLPGTTNLAVVPTPTPAPAAAAPLKLTDDQARAVVLIRGDNGEGTGFLIKTPDGPVVITNQHVISNNPNLKITTSTGVEIQTLSLKGATDRDLAMFAIKDAGYNYLDWANDVSNTAQPGDEVITPGNSQGGEVMLNTGGKVLGIGPQRVEFDNPIYHGNSGGPVFHVKSGKVLAVVTEAEKVDTSNALDKASFNNHNSAIAGSMRYFGLRLDTVPKWEDLDWNRFQRETLFLEQFHHQSRTLDSYLNTLSGPDANLYSTDEKIKSANDTYAQQLSGGDASQRMDALRELLVDLNGIADNNLDSVQDMNNFYSFDQQRAKDEADYRKALKNELDSIGNDVSRLGSLARKNTTDKE